MPCLPGYPFGAPVTAPGMSTTAMGEAVVAMLDALGVRRCVLSGGDIGSGVATAIAARHPRARRTPCTSPTCPWAPLSAMPEDELTAEERDYRDRGRRWQRPEGGYMHEHATKPHTLAAALADSPAGLAAWIVEKLRSWSDCGGDVESVFPREDLLTWVTAYWVTGTIGTSFSPYVEPREPVGRLDVPTAITLFPHDLVLAPRSFAERCFDLRMFRQEPAGGHFAAWERPERSRLRAAVAPPAALRWCACVAAGDRAGAARDLQGLPA